MCQQKYPERLVVAFTCIRVIPYGRAAYLYSCVHSLAEARSAAVQWRAQQEGGEVAIVLKPWETISNGHPIKKNSTESNYRGGVECLYTNHGIVHGHASKSRSWSRATLELCTPLQ